MSAMEQLHPETSLVDALETGRWMEAVLAEVSAERHTAEDHRRCGLCGELTQAAVCCGQEV